MTNILSSVSAQFGKALILGTLLPVAMFLAAGVVIVQLLLGGTLRELLAGLGTGRQVIVWPLVALTLSAVLYHLNVPLTRLYEGYPWERSWLGRRRIAAYQRRFEALSARWRGIRTLLYFSRRRPGAPAVAAPIQRYWNEIGRALRSEYPETGASILPTRLGNVIRSFENYPRMQYGMSAIPLWPRLLAKIDSTYATAIDNARIAVDFALNCSFLSASLAFALLAFGLFHPRVPSSHPAMIFLLLAIAGCLALSYLFYVMLVGRAATWGDMVKSAFDLYRRPLLAQLAYEAAPRTLRQERMLWADISQQLLFGDSPRVRPATFARATATARGEPDHVVLQVTRGVTPPRWGREWLVTIGVTNDNESPAPVDRVVATDTVPAGFQYVWRSATATVTGVNPYQFSLGRLDPGHTRVVTYRIAQLDRKPSGGEP